MRYVFRGDFDTKVRHVDRSGEVQEFACRPFADNLQDLKLAHFEASFGLFLKARGLSYWRSQSQLRARVLNRCHVTRFLVISRTLDIFVRIWQGYFKQI